MEAVKKWLYFPGADEGGAGEPWMTDSHSGHFILQGNQLIQASYGGTPTVVAELRDGLWYHVETPVDGRPLVYFEVDEGDS